MFFKTDAQPGSNLYGCVAANTWTTLGGAMHTHPVTDLNGITGKQGTGTLLATFGGGSVNTGDCATFDSGGSLISSPCPSGGGGLPSMTGNGQRILSNDGSLADWRLIGPGLIMDGTQLGVDSAAIAGLQWPNTYTATNLFQATLQSSGPGAAVDFAGAQSTSPVKSGITFPSACAANRDMFIKTDATAGQQLFLCSGSGTGWTLVGGAAAAIDPSTAVPPIYDDFLPGRGGSSFTSGQLGWAVSGNSADVEGEANHPGVISIQTAASSGSSSSLKLGPQAARAFASINSLLFDGYYIVKTSTITSAAYMTGFGADSASIPTFGTSRVTVEFDTSLGDTNWMFVACNAGTCTRTNSGVPVGASTWYKMRIRSISPGAVLFSINGGTEISIATNLPVTPQNVGFRVQTHDSAQKDFLIDYFGFAAAVAR
jgi:hypothetical protein